MPVDTRRVRVKAVATPRDIMYHKYHVPATRVAFVVQEMDIVVVGIITDIAHPAYVEMFRLLA
jgi:hypothetical protein